MTTQNHWGESNHSTYQRLTEVFESAQEIPFDDSSKFILFSDLHRGMRWFGDHSQPSDTYSLYQAELRQFLNRLALGHQSDAYSLYEAGLHQLKEQIEQKHSRDSEVFRKVLVYEQRLTENIVQSRAYGDTDTRKAERSEAIARLNELTLAELDKPFVELSSRQELAEHVQELTMHVQELAERAQRLAKRLWSDDAVRGRSLLFHALNYYYREGFTYIEIGDGDELWERRFEDIRKADSHIFLLMRELHKVNRLYLIWGERDIEREDRRYVAKQLHEWYNERAAMMEPVLPGITVHEGLVLRHSGTGNKVFLVHGHQGDLFNDRLWRFSRFFVRYIWKPLWRVFDIPNPTSPAENDMLRRRVEKRIMEWIRANNNQMVICGHTHRPIFPEVQGLPYFNVGSGVHPRALTGIEILNGRIALIKWQIWPDDDGVLRLGRDVLQGPQEFPWGRLASTGEAAAGC